MFIMMPLTLWFMTLANPDLNEVTYLTVGVMVFNFLVGAIAEVARKTYAPEAEREKVDSYTKYFGVRGTTLLLFAFDIVLFFIAAAYLWIGNNQLLSLIGLVLLALGFKKILSFRSQATVENAKGIEKSQGLFLLGHYFLLNYAFISL